MTREKDTETNGSSEGNPNGGDGAWNRRAILSALAGAPVILTLSSSLAQADSVAGPSVDLSDLEYLCLQPRDDLDPGDAEKCENPV